MYHFQRAGTGPLLFSAASCLVPQVCRCDCVEERTGFWDEDDLVACADLAASVSSVPSTLFCPLCYRFVFTDF